MRFLFTFAAVACSFASVSLSAQEQEQCEVVDQDGSLVLVPCCNLTSTLGDDETPPSEGDPCLEVKRVTDTKDLEVLERAAIDHRMRSFAKFLRSTPSTEIRGFTVEPPPLLVFLLWCCDCIPGQSCSVGDIRDVCTITTDGTCPAGTLRTLCEGGLADPICVGVD